jgi:hypothetical protein
MLSIIYKPLMLRVVILSVVAPLKALLKEPLGPLRLNPNYETRLENTGSDTQTPAYYIIVSLSPSKHFGYQ